MDFLIQYFSTEHNLIVLFQYFVIGFFINLLWEVLHSQLYETCLRIHLSEYIPRIIFASIKDGFFITLFIVLSMIIFQNTDILSNIYQSLFFGIICLVFSYIDEKVSLHYKRWEYTKAMPMIFGVGISPFLEVAITGFITLFIVSIL